MKQYAAHFRSMDRSMKIYIFMWGMVGFSVFGLQSVLLNLYMVHLGFDADDIGRFLAAAQICFGLAALPAGVLGARRGPRAGLMAGTALVAAGWALFTAAESLPPGAVGAGLQVGLALANMGQATMIVNGAPYLMAISDEHNRFYYLSFQQAFQALAGLAGGFAAGAVPGALAAWAGGGRADADFYRHTLALMPVLFLTACFTLLRARAVLLLPPPSGPTAAPARARFPWAVFAAYPVIIYLAIVGDFGSRTFFNLYLHELGLNTQQIGLMFGVNQLAPLITAVSIPAVLNRIGTGRTFSAGAVLLGAVLLFQSLAGGLAAAGAGFFLMSLMATSMQATRSLWGQELVEPRWRTFIASTGTISMSLGSASSSLLGGYIIPTLGFASLFRTSAVLVCAAGLLALAFLRLRRQ